MRMTSRTKVLITGLHNTSEVAELTKLAMKAGYNLTLQGDDAAAYSSGEGRPFVLELSREDPVWLEQEIAWLVYLQALHSNRSPNDVIEAARTRLENLHTTMGMPPTFRCAQHRGGT